MASLGVALWKRICVCVPGLYPKIPSLFYPCKNLQSVLSMLTQTLWAQGKATGLSGPSPPPDWPHSELSNVM